MALRRHTHARGGCPWRRLPPHRKSSLHPHHIQVPATAHSLPFPVREGKTRRRSEQKFVPPEETLALTLPPTGDGMDLLRTQKKQPAP